MGGQPEVILIGKGYRPRGQVRVAEKAQVIRGQPLFRTLEQDHRVGVRLGKLPQDVAGSVRGAVITDPERPILMGLCRECGQLLVQMRGTVACAHKQGDMGQGGHGGSLGRTAANFNLWLRIFGKWPEPATLLPQMRGVLPGCLRQGSIRFRVTGAVL